MVRLCGSWLDIVSSPVGHLASASSLIARGRGSKGQGFFMLPLKHASKVYREAMGSMAAAAPLNGFALVIASDAMNPQEDGCLAFVDKELSGFITY